ncbi:MAG: hypothetical protein RRB13_10040 [bacterium]|nr:hypothetical protein [bacterium]
MKLWLAIIFILLIGPAPVRAGWELEVDPFAYGLKGYSGHLAWAASDWRVDAGVFGLETPTGYYQEHWVVKMDGYGAKLHFLSDGAFFWGLAAGGGHLTFGRDDLASEQVRNFTSSGLEAGWRFGTGNWYWVPWVGVNRFAIAGEPVDWAGDTLEMPGWQVFPTIHLGFRF